MHKFILIASGGALGALFRFLVSQFINQISGKEFPWSTLTVNLLGCFLIGLLWSFSERHDWNESTNLFLFVGMLGAFTTFSTYGLEGLEFLQTGEIIKGGTYIIASNTIGLLAVLLGKNIVVYL